MIANMVILASGYTLSMRAAPLVHSNVRACAPVMQEDIVDGLPWGDPREGKPFGEADGPNRPVGKVRGAVEAFQPRGITDASVIKPAYIETEDEPWCACGAPLPRDPFMLWLFTEDAHGAVHEASDPLLTACIV